MPVERATGPAKRKAPAFKPPRPAAKPKNTTKATPRRKSGQARPPASLSSSDDEAVVEASQSPLEVTAPILSREPQLFIPSELLSRLLKHHFADEETGIGKDAKAVVGKYLETFVREALARAAFERSEAEGNGGRGGDFLEVGSFFLVLIRRLTCVY